MILGTLRGRVMGLHAWCLRCIPGFSIVFLFALIIIALTDSATLTLPFSPSSSRPPYHQTDRLRPDGDKHTPTLNWAQTIFALYNVLIHVLALLFPLRLIWSLYQITIKVQEMTSQPTNTFNGNGIDTKSRTVGSPASSLPPLTTSPGGSSSSRSDDSDHERNDDMGMIVHAILLPNYKEELDTFRETLDVLASHAQARSSYDVWLAMEDNDPNAHSSSAILVGAYARFFRNIRFTIHPSGLAGEVQGKSSNISWVAHEAIRTYNDQKIKRNCIMTVMDADTHLSSIYFAQLSKLHFEHPETAATTLYAAPIIFDRNAHKVPTLVRLADIVWCAAGLSGLYPGSTIIIPTSVYSISMPLAEMVGGWDTGAQAIGEDLHMYLKCYFGAIGGLTTRVIYSPASQSNVVGDRHGIRGYIKSLQARYRQAMRHMWGALDTGFACAQAGLLISRLTSTAASSNTPYADKSSPNNRPPSCPSLFSLFMLTHRLFEAHFLTVHLFMLLLAGTVYQFLTPRDLAPPLLLASLDLAGKLRAGAFICMLCAFFAYESYHAVCVRAREDEMRRARLYQRMRGDISKFEKGGWMHWVQYLMFPIPGIVFVTLPSIIAQLSHFGTEKLDYEVSLKPSASAGAIDGDDAERGVDDYERERGGKLPV